MVGYIGHSQHSTGNRIRIACFILCRRRGQDMRLVRGNETSRSGGEDVCPFRIGKGGGHLRPGTDDGTVQNCTGINQQHYDGGGILRRGQCRPARQH